MKLKIVSYFDQQRYYIGRNLYFVNHSKFGYSRIILYEWERLILEHGLTMIRKYKNGPRKS